jgi:hypothetical protein
MTKKERKRIDKLERQTRSMIIHAICDLLKQIAARDFWRGKRVTSRCRNHTTLSRFQLYKQPCFGTANGQKSVQFNKMDSYWRFVAPPRKCVTQGGEISRAVNESTQLVAKSFEAMTNKLSSEGHPESGRPTGAQAAAMLHTARTRDADFLDKSAEDRVHLRALFGGEYGYQLYEEYDTFSDDAEARLIWLEDHLLPVRLVALSLFGSSDLRE